MKCLMLQAAYLKEHHLGVGSLSSSSFVCHTVNNKNIHVVTVTESGEAETSKKPPGPGCSKAG